MSNDLLQKLFPIGGIAAIGCRHHEQNRTVAVETIDESTLALFVAHVTSLVARRLPKITAAQGHLRAAANGRPVQLPFYRIDAFTRRAFGGNPAAVVPLQRWLDDPQLQAIATEENLPATAFFAPAGDELRLRWFAPSSELELCGHATLATAHVLFNRLQPQRDQLTFVSGAGRLEARRDGPRVALDFPALPPLQERSLEEVAAAIGVAPVEVWEAAGGRGLAVVADAAAVRTLRPNVAALSALPFSALIVTARGVDGDCDFVSRYFAPKHGVAEDFVTGSAHCVLTPYWAGVLAKPRLFARQLSSRGGELWVEDCGNRVRIAGECVPTAEGTLLIP